MTTPTDRAARVTVAAVALLAAHELGDHWVQRHQDAEAKKEPGRAGANACARHVATLTATKAAALTAAAVVTGVRFPVARLGVALAADALSHYALDRRVPNGSMDKLAKRFGKTPFLALGDGKLAPLRYRGLRPRPERTQGRAVPHRARRPLNIQHRQNARTGHTDHSHRRRRGHG